MICIASCLVDQVVAKYTYQAQQEDELSFTKGVVINVLSREDPEWWQGELDGKVGVFPFNYVSSLTDPGEEHYGTVIQSSITSSMLNCSIFLHNFILLVMLVFLFVAINIETVTSNSFVYCCSVFTFIGSDTSVSNLCS